MTSVNVVAAQAGTQGIEDGNAGALDSRLRGNDGSRHLRGNDGLRPVIGLMLGDMTGIGPEISARLLAGKTLRPLARIAVVCMAAVGKTTEVH